MKLANAFDDGWELDDGEALHREAPDTFNSQEQGRSVIPSRRHCFTGCASGGLVSGSRLGFQFCVIDGRPSKIPCRWCNMLRTLRTHHVLGHC